MSENAMDKKIQKLFDKVQEKKEEIKKAEKPNWKTNSTFGFDPSSSKRTNLQVVGDVKILVGILSFLYEKSDNFDKASKKLGVDGEFEWMGFPLSDWEEDLTTRVNKIQITKKKAELEKIETTLDRLISPERRREMELEAIEKLLEVGSQFAGDYCNKKANSISDRNKKFRYINLLFKAKPSLAFKLYKDWIITNRQI